MVATCDREQRLAALLRSLRRQTLDPDEFEVIVVDDSSRDGTWPLLVAERDSGPPFALRAVRHAVRCGPAAARNTGWRAARGQLVAFTDDDCVVAPGWLEAGLRAIDERPDSIVQGPTDPDPAELDRRGPFSRTIRTREGEPFFQTCNIFYPRRLLERVGGFDAERFPVTGEDTDLAWRSLAAGAEVVWAPDAAALHAVNVLGPVGRLRTAWRYRRGLRVYAEHPGFRRRNSTWHIFFKPTHLWFVRAVLALGLPRSHAWLQAWAMGLYVKALWARGRFEGGGSALIPYFAVYDAVEIAGCLWASARYGTLIV